MVSGSVPTPTLAFSVLKSALIVELLPTPVAPVIIRLIFVQKILHQLAFLFLWNIGIQNV